MNNKTSACCEMCAYYDYDFEEDRNICTVNMDEDDFMRFISDKHQGCPFFVFYDEYKIVRKQN